MIPVHIFGESIIEQAAIDQLHNCMLEDSIGVLTADAHKGYAQPVGGAIAYRNHVSPSGVGYDIGCGNKAVQTSLLYPEIQNDIPRIMDEIYRRISFGMGRANNEKIDDEVLQDIEQAEFVPQRGLIQLAENQLGTVGGGNHFVDLFVGTDNKVWIGVHFGSRGFGHKTASGFLAMARGLTFNDRVTEGSMDAKPVLFDIKSQIGQDYLAAMHLAGMYAMSGRNAVVNRVLDILGNPKVTQVVHNHHNFSWYEEHGGIPYYVVRKGCTPAFPGQLGFIGSNMQDASFIVQGVNSQEAQKGLYSTVHGAGRVLSRTQAAGKKKWIRGEDGKKRPQIVSEGLVNWEETKEKLKTYNVELRGGGADEAPQCYKNLVEVLMHQGNTIKIIETLIPIGVAMAGPETGDDPYRD